MHNPQLMSDLVSRLPSSLRLQWGEQVTQDPNRITLADFSTWLSAKAEALSYVISETADSPPRPTAEALLATPQARSSQQHRSRQPPKCAFCSYQHWSNECKKYTTVTTRQAQLMAQNRCFKCLRPGHSARHCRSPPKDCFYCKARGHHHQSLCPKQYGVNPASATRRLGEHATAVTVAEPSPPPPVLTPTEPANLAAGKETVRMQSATAQVSNPSTTRASMAAHILFDTGSYRTYITAELADKLQLKPTSEETLAISTFGSNNIKKMTAATAELTVHFLNGRHHVITATIVPTITGKIASTTLPAHVLRNVPPGWQLADNYSTCAGSEASTIDILLGNDFYHDFVNPHRHQLAPGLYLLDTNLGWMVSGRLTLTSADAQLSTDEPATTDPSLLIVPSTSSSDAPPLDQFWRMETIGISDSPYDSDDAAAQSLFDKSITHMNGRYEVGWPWKPGHDLPDNYQLAKGRLTSLLRRLRRDTDTLGRYDDIIQKQLKAGIIEVVPQDTDSTKRHYLPHHSVSSPGSVTTKLRIVYDGSAKTNEANSSLNDCLYRGPVLLQDLAGILLRFRLQRVAITADIEKAFLQIGLHPPDRDVTRFLWLKDATTPTAHADNLQEFRFTRVPFGVVCSPFLLAATVQHHLQTTNDAISTQLQRDLYVDNLITGTDSTTDAVDLYHKAKITFKSANMNLRSWSSNSETFLEQVPQEDRDERTGFKVLGLRWHRVNDTLAVPAPDSTSLQAATTKRAILHCVAAVYDPLGLLSPVTIPAKILLQDLWQAKVGWDDDLPQPYLERWTELLKDLLEIAQLCLPRYIGPPTDDECTHTLLCFCDASGKAYAAAVYLHTMWSSGSSTHLVFSKTRLAPTKPITIPRLELMATVLGIRCLQFVRTQLHLPLAPQDTLWSDSQCVIGWLRSPQPHMPVFVANRLRTIRTHPATIRFVASSDNPADLPSRGVPPSVLATEKKWWQGPDWLSLPAIEWPTWNVTPQPLQDVPSFPTSPSVVFETKLVALDRPVDNSVLAKLLARVSTLSRLLRITAWIQRFLHNARQPQLRQQAAADLTAQEMASARLWWIRHIQQIHFAPPLQALLNKRQHPLIRQLDLFIGDDGLLRCGGRLKHAELPPTADHPILLPPEHEFTVLVIHDLHRQMQHVGTSHTLSQLRRKYWIPRGRQAVKKAIAQCRTCRRYQGPAFRMPRSPDMPPERVTRSPPFTYTAVDYFGPLYCTDRSGEGKVWVALYTCLAIRAVHLEVATDLSAEQFLLTLRRFIARRGTPKQILSDNAPQFQVADQMLQSLWSTSINQTCVQSYMSDRGITRRFIPAHAPWMGGVYERLVRIVKSCLRKTLGRARLCTDQLATLLVEVEAVVNTRPLVYVGADDCLSLSPADLLQQHTSIGLPDAAPIHEDPDYTPPDTRKSLADTLLDAWRRGQNLVNHFWQTWKAEYLAALREKQRATLNRKDPTTVQFPLVGDVVQIGDSTSRGCWRLGRITRLHESRDKAIRSADILLANKRTVQRPLNALYPLEATSSGTQPSSSSPESAPASSPVPALRRSERIAARVAQEDLAACT